MFTSETVRKQLVSIARIFETGQAPKMLSYATIEKKKGMPAANWSFGNQAMCIFTTGELDCRGFNQWKNIGRSVIKGARATYILIPIFSKHDKNVPEGFDVDLIGFRACPVFPYSVTDGEPLLLNVPEKLPEFADVAEKLGISVKYDYQSGSYGVFCPDKKEIKLITEHPQVMLHELAHGVHYMVDETAKEMERAKKECIVELCACTLACLYNLPCNLGFSQEYIKSYKGKNQFYLYGLLNTCGKIVEKIIAVKSGIAAIAA